MEPELELLNAAKQRNQEAIVKIFDLYASPLYNYALRLCGDPLQADHIVGDVFAKLVEQLAAGNGPTSNLRSYLYQTAYHIIIDEARSSQRRVSLDVLTSLPQDASSDSLPLEDRIIFEKILQAIRNALTDDQRHVITLRFLEGFSLRETAAILGKEISHVKVIQNRAVAKLRKVLKSRVVRTPALLPRVKELSKTLRV